MHSHSFTHFLLSTLSFLLYSCGRFVCNTVTNTALALPCLHNDQAWLFLYFLVQCGGILPSSYPQPKACNISPFPQINKTADPKQNHSEQCEEDVEYLFNWIRVAYPSTQHLLQQQTNSNDTEPHYYQYDYPIKSIPASGCITVLFISSMECLLLGELGPIKVRVNLKRIIDQNGILKNEIVANSSNQVYFTLQLYTHGKAQGTTQASHFFVPKNLFDEPIIFNYHYHDLTLDSKVAISIWSSAKKNNPNKPLGSTVIQLFDEKGELRQGKYHLFIWPNLSPDVEDPSSTPGLANDENIEILNFISDRLEECDKSNDPYSSKAEQTLKFRLSYIYRLIPAAFLQVEFPKFQHSVFFNDKISSDYEETTFPEGSKSEIAQCLEIYDPDEEKQATNPFEEMYYALKSEKQTNSENAAPSKEQVREMETIASKSFRIEIKTADKQTLFKFRYYLVQDRKYLSYFLNSLPQQYNEQGELEKLLSKWQKIDQADALYLLSRDFSLNLTYNKKKYSLAILNLIRNYAVTIIDELKDQELIYILLFLVQSLRYENELYQSSLYELLFRRAGNSQQIASLLYWYLKTQSEPLPTKEAKASKEGEKNIKIFQIFFAKFQFFIKQNSKEVADMINRQIKLFQVLKLIAKSVKEAKDKKSELRKRLAEVDWQSVGNVCYPMDVSVVLLSPVIEECTVFSSAMAPMKLTFSTVGEKKFSFLFKSGDDLRQDQMVLEMFDLMDRLLKGVNQDYKLTPYKALACSKTDGFVEFVPETRTFQQTKLKEYLQKLVQQKSAEVMQNYVFSCAGYCAITYFFGIGDRHLENLLISSSGKMLHIDFGFILGRDPKPYPPPIKIRKDMIEAMGGLQHPNFKTFKAKCLEAFLYLRKHGKIVYNLVYLMLDSGLKDVHAEGIAKLFDKFIVGMNDTEAEKHFLMVLEECKNAIAAIIADGIHRWASHFK